MTREEKREQWLKRILPALVITVIYFVFVSGLVGEDAKQARLDYEGMAQKGISAEAIPGLIKRQNSAQAEIARLKREHEAYRKKLVGIAGFLTRKTPDIEAMQVLSNILADNQLLIVEEQSVKYPSEQLPASIQEIKHWLKDSIDKEADSIYVEHLQLTGSFAHMYAAMLEIAEGRLAAIPVMLTMRENLDDNETPTGDLHWDLVLWM